MRAIAVAALAVVAALALAACSEDPVAAPTPTADASPTPTPTPTGDDAAADEVTVYYVREHDSGLWVEPEVVPLDEPTVAVARAAMEALVGHEPRDPARMSLTGEDARVLDVTTDGEILVVDFASLHDGLGSAFEAALIQQIAHTGAQFDTITAVRILIDGEEVESVAGHIETREPVEPDPFALSPITFTSHANGDEVAVGDVTVRGEACTFEATLELRLVAPDGSVAEETFTTASSACPERGAWEHTFTLDEAGTWTIVAVEPDPSDGEGRPPFETAIELEAR